jgi:protein ImuB
VDPTACIDLPAFPLQLLLKKNRDWREHPTAVVEADTPQGTILWINERARPAGISTGMRYAGALSLSGQLRAATVPRSEIDENVSRISERLRRLTPNVESSKEEPGVFWLDARGLERLFGTRREWAGAVAAAIAEAGFLSSIVVGFDRFAAYAVAKGGKGKHFFESVDEERKAARAVRLDRLALPPATRDTLARLGVATLGAFADLPLDGIGTRFGAEVRRLHRLATGALEEPLRPEHPDAPVLRRLILDQPEKDSARIVYRIEDELPSMLEEVGKKGHALSALEIGFRFERLGSHLETIEPASPTLSPKTVLELVRLRFEAVRRLPDEVAEIVLLARETTAIEKQRQLFAEKRRDLDAAGRALARLRAAFGEDAVVRAELKDAHLPEARFAWTPVASIPEARPHPYSEPRLIRRIRTTPAPLPPRERHEPDGWILHGLEQGPVVKVAGPYPLSGSWWGSSYQRDYHYAELKSGETIWVFYDRDRNRWFLQGEVE